MLSLFGEKLCKVALFLGEDNDGGKSEAKPNFALDVLGLATNELECSEWTQKRHESRAFQRIANCGVYYDRENWA